MEDFANGMRPSEVSVDDAVKTAIGLHRSGELADAEILYRRILEACPEQAEALHFLGLLERQRGRSDEALALMRKAILVAPDYGSAHNNLGNLLLERRDFDAARASLDAAFTLLPDDVLILNNIGVAQRGSGDSEGARKTFERAVELEPEFALPFENLGRYYFMRGEIAVAHEYFCRAVVIDPALTTSNQFLGIALVRLGRIDDARDFYTKWSAHEPDNPVPPHMLATVSGEALPRRASDAYVRCVFDTFASSFDQQLSRLEYRAPELLIEALRGTGAAPEARLDILDAGCGTGLCGKLLRPFARRLEGVDLSPRMLDRARCTAAYDGIFEGELTAYLAARIAEYDVVASADTLCYFGDLAAVAIAAHGALRAAGHFIFSVEARGGDAQPGYVLGESGRFAHSRAYLQEVLVGAGFESPQVRNDTLRMEAGTPVDGFVVVARRR